MYRIQNTLYVMTPNAYAHLENATLRIDAEHQKKLQIPLHHLGGLVCFGNVMVSPALMPAGGRRKIAGADGQHRAL
jgi:CRISPR-associated protein Cas1